MGSSDDKSGRSSDGAAPRPGAGLASLATAEAVSAEAVRIYGCEPKATGVVHVTAVWQRTDGMLVALRTGGDAPRFPHDALALGLARSRADAIVTTGEILRREPDLRIEPPGPGALPAGLADWRRRVLGKARPPLLWVMTRSGEVDLEHPVFGHPGRSVVYGGRSASWTLESRAADAGIELVAADEPSIHDSIGRLRREFGAATVVVEAGPSVARALYADESAPAEPAGLPELPVRVDELMLTALHRGDLETRYRGPSFLARADVEAVLGRPTSTHRVRSGAGDASGDWELARYVRR